MDVSEQRRMTDFVTWDGNVRMGAAIYPDASFFHEITYWQSPYQSHIKTCCKQVLVLLSDSTHRFGLYKEILAERRSLPLRIAVTEEYYLSHSSGSTLLHLLNLIRRK